jgi:ubiquinone/menaquinone biosynthesis C-methylase UbiE
MNIGKIIKNFTTINKPKLTVGLFNESNRINWLENTLSTIEPGKSILDAGAGEQQFKRFCSHLKYVSQDFAQYKPQEVNLGLQMTKWDYGTLDIVSDIASIPVEAESFDAVMCTEVFEHIINPREALREFARVLKKDGKLIITAPFCSLTHFAPYHFYTGFSKYFYETALIENGFEIIELRPNGNYFEFLAQEVNRVPDIASKYSNQKLQKKQINAINEMNKMLQQFSDKDTNSSELLCFGYHLVAVKK